jgi:hypothetical protein
MKKKGSLIVSIIFFSLVVGIFLGSKPSLGMIIERAAIGDLVWFDSNANGIQDEGEVGVAGVTVNLYNGIGGFVDSMLTDSNGLYLFDYLTPGDYFVEFVLPEGAVFSPQDQGADDAFDSDADTSTGRTVITNLVNGETDLTWDAGIYIIICPPASIGDYVWNDLDKDGIQDAGELGIGGVSVNLYDGSGLVASTVTDGSGYYLFTGLTPGDYYLEFVLIAGFLFSPQDQVANDAIDSDADTTTGLTVMTTLDCGEVDLTWDAGMYEKEPPGDFEGETPGFWKRHTDLWVGYTTEMVLGDIFTFPAELSSLADISLLDALKSGGGKGIIGKAKNLLRSAVAALLNSAHPDVNYPLSESEIISAVNAALASLNEVTMGDLHKELDKFNNLGSDL